MWGKHPKTGKPIRILQTENCISRDRKTIAWVPAERATEAPWERWEVGSIGLKNLTKKTSVLVLCDPAELEQNVAWFRTGAWQPYSMILTSKEVLDVLGEEELKNLGIGNMICLEEVHELYPFVSAGSSPSTNDAGSSPSTSTGGKWDGTAEDAALLASLLLRKYRALGLPTNKGRAIVVEPLTPPPQLWMITQFFKAKKADRMAEITKCLVNNLLCPFVDKTVLLTEEDMSAHIPKPSPEKVLQEIVKKRLTYAMVIKWIKEKAPPNTICVFANSDIYLDITWSAVWSTKLEGRFLSLLRYEAVEGVPNDQHILFGPRPDSQDTWAILSDSVKEKTWKYEDLDFPFGKAGCDNAINMEMLRAGFLVVNPSLTIKTHHVHESPLRTYDKTDIVDKNMYFYIKPTGLHDMAPLFMPTPTHILPVASFPRPVRGPVQNHLRTFCTMVSKGDTLANGQVLTYGTDNKYIATEPVKVYEAPGVFQTNTGLAYTYDSIYVGKSKAAADAWNKSTVSKLRPSLPVDIGLIAPLPDAFLETPLTFILKYISNILVLREKAEGKGEFWLPRSKPFMDAIQIFNWGQKEVPVIPRDEGIQTYCEKAYIMLPTDNTLISREQVALLRKHLIVRKDGKGSRWISERDTEKRTVVFFDETYCNHDFVSKIEGNYNVEVVWPENTSIETLVEKLSGAYRLITASVNIGWAWILPVNSTVIEIQNEMMPNAEGLHLASAAELIHLLILAPKGRITDNVRSTLVRHILTPVVSTLDTKVPILIIPTKPVGDFYHHSGDSFREMAVMWADKGYVRIIEDSHAHHVWLHGIGNTLLYDRPTYKWLENAPPEERRFVKALFGNPAPVNGGKAWSFWPRRPALVEELAPKATATWSERLQRLVFYGRTENDTQRKHRPLEWLNTCSAFSMPDGLVKYPYTQREYLEKLGQTKFGLCLPGFGLKCHREVECMAMGCVPIVSPGVDIGGYANPPVEGVHYFKAETPEDAQRLSEETDEATWVKMSEACKAWWLANSSCDGMWALTQSLLK